MGTQDLSGCPTGMTPTPSPAPAQQIAEGAENCLRHNSYLALKNVQCECDEGVLTLRGCLPSYYLKQMAQAIVARVEGVIRIVNEIEVVSSHSAVIAHSWEGSRAGASSVSRAR